MRDFRIFLLSILIVSVAFSCQQEDTPTPADPLVRSLSATESEVAASANNFTFDLMTHIDEEFPNENYFISSFSVSTALSMTLNGAAPASQEGFKEVLGLEGMSTGELNSAYQSLVQYIYGLDPSVTLAVANSNWYSHRFTINGDFADILTKYYQAEIFERDFGNEETLPALNGWVETKTNGKIKNILDRINPDDVMFLINTIYFKANWSQQFDPKATRDLHFTLENGQSVEVPTMMAEVKHWKSYASEWSAQVIEIPYGNENYAFTIIMPDDPSEINELISKINATTLHEALVDSTTLVRDLYLPKFKLDFKTDLKETLVNMGMPITGLDNLFEENPPLAISKVIHQSFLEVNEEGSEAAAATVVGVELTAMPATTNVNQPFVFLIRERNSGTILFSGKLIDPR